MTTIDHTDANDTTDPARWEPTRSFAVNGVELAWDRWGPDTGTPFVLCHGFSGSAHDWALHIDTLAATRPLISMDHRGHGRSTKTHDVATYTIEQLSADLIAFLDANTDGAVDLLGHSMGGRIALQVVLDRPDLVRSLILMDTSAWSFESVDDDIRAMLLAFFSSYDPTGGLPDLAAMRGPEDELIDATTPLAWRQRKEELSAAFDPYALRALGGALFAGTALSVREQLPTITCPVTVIAGARDHPFVDQAPELTAEVADGQQAIIDGAFHSPQLTHRAEWRAAVAGHLARVTD